MSYTLNIANRGYRISFTDAFYSVVTGFSGVFYAKRHWDLSCKIDPKYSFGHRLIGNLESIPIVGLLLALIDRVCAFVYNKLFHHQLINMTAEDLIAMHSTAQDTILRRRREGCATLKDSLPPIEEFQNRPPSAPWTFNSSSFESIGRRKSLEDAHFMIEIPQGFLAGLFDGHGGKMVAEYFSDAFKTRFSKELTGVRGYIRRAFNDLSAKIQDEMVQRPEWGDMGTTAVVSFIDKSSHLVFTLTLGDSEVVICRVIKHRTRIIPLSNPHNWSDGADAKRASVAESDPTMERRLTREKSHPKDLRVHCLNVSRAFGDYNNPAVTHTPEITINLLQEGDVVLMGCDGLFDEVPKSDIIKVIKDHRESGYQNLAKDLVDYAIEVKKSQDNVTVIIVEPKKSPADSQ